MGQKILLDTCSFLWLVSDHPRFSSRARELFADPDNEIFLSAVSAWEITVKSSAGRLTLPKPASEFVSEWREKHGISSLPFEETSAVYESRLPRLHGDPFDRMLICQSIVHGLAILTPDADITRYPVHTLW